MKRIETWTYILCLIFGIFEIYFCSQLYKENQELLQICYSLVDKNVAFKKNIEKMLQMGISNKSHVEKVMFNYNPEIVEINP